MAINLVVQGARGSMGVSDNPFLFIIDANWDSLLSKR